MDKKEADRKQAEGKNVIIYWWNMGRKTLDFNGKLKDFLKKKDIKVRRTPIGYQWRLNLYATNATINTTGHTTSDYIRGANDAIKTFLTLLGDKTLYHPPSGYGREYRLNW